MIVTYSEKTRREILKSDIRNAREHLARLIEVKKYRPAVTLINKYYKELYEAYNEIDKAIDKLSDLIIKIEIENWDITEEMLYEDSNIFDKQET